MLSFPQPQAVRFVSHVFREFDRASSRALQGWGEADQPLPDL